MRRPSLTQRCAKGRERLAQAIRTLRHTEPTPPSPNWANDRLWLQTRREYLRRQPLCEVCRELGFETPATQVDHIVARRKGGDKYAFTNLMALCAEHHSSKTRRYDGGGGSGRRQSAASSYRPQVIGADGYLKTIREVPHTERGRTQS